MMQVSSYQVWVHDQDAALAFYRDMLGMEVRTDVTVPEMGDFRWLTVAFPGQDTELVLMAVPGAPVADDATAAQIRDLMGKGMATAVFLTTDDCQKAYEELSARGVEFLGEPEQQMYGIDVGLRDVSGNHLRLTQLSADFG